MKVAAAALAVALLALGGVSMGAGRSSAPPRNLPQGIQIEDLSEPGAIRPSPRPTVEEVEHEIEDLDDSGRGRGRGRGRGGDEDRSGSNSGSG